MRTHYGPWQPCWISNQYQKLKSGRGPSSEHFWQVWLISVQRFQRRRFKCEKLTDGRTMDAYPWQKLTWPMARWAKNYFTINLHRKISSRGHDQRSYLKWPILRNQTAVVEKECYPTNYKYSHQLTCICATCYRGRCSPCRSSLNRDISDTFY